LSIGARQVKSSQKLEAGKEHPTESRQKAPIQPRIPAAHAVFLYRRMRPDIFGERVVTAPIERRWGQFSGQSP
jgi:hypothetical protein